MAKREDRLKKITEQRREQILGAALQVFSRQGFDKSTVPDIARQAGIAVGTIYNYYPSKRDVLVAITNKYIIAPFAELVNNPPDHTDAGFIAAIMENRLNFGLEGLEKFLPLFLEVQRDPELRRQYSEKVIRPIMGMMEKLVASRINAGAFRDVNPSVVTRAIGGMVIGFMLLYRIEGENSPAHGVDRKKLADELTGLILHGLRKTEGSASRQGGRR